MSVEPEFSKRGFKHFPPIPSSYGGEIRVYESSAASHPHVWVATTCLVNSNEPAGPQIEAIVHLRLEDAAVLRDQLSYLIEHHYQGPLVPEG